MIIKELNGRMGYIWGFKQKDMINGQRDEVR